MTKNSQNIAYYISLLKKFPPNRKTNKRRAYLRLLYLENKKVFFAIFCQKIFQNKYNNDRLRRVKIIQKLPDIFKTIKPEKSGDKYIFITPFEKVIIKKEKNEFNLLSLYPL